MVVRRSLDELPHNARDIRGVFSGETEAGVPFEVHNTPSRRPMRSNELMKAAINAKVRGRPMASLQVEEQRLFLLVHNRHRIEIEQTSSNMYRYGRRFDRSLRELVTQVMEDMGVEITPPASPRL